DEEERVAIRGSPHDRLRGDISTGARPVLDDKLLAKSLREPLTDQASDDVDAAAGWNADDNAHRPRWIGLRPRDTRHRRERGRARDQMQKISAGKFHLEPPSSSHYSITSSPRASSVWAPRCRVPSRSESAGPDQRRRAAVREHELGAGV